ncbi:hypothetical protein DCAR_0100162 [Daucus carota subsp. sativus]|uniref:Uncharacterized protein n=1 Tax=Daucus carota subsp. sativus TaxID=79200 RepID=A0AAF1AHU1_DAUCS|nr:hypothetical protein DCAR_0100162 [Daucus carota subsp. sativus]
MRCATQRYTLSPLPLFWLCHYPSRVAPDQLTYFSSDSSTIPTSNLLAGRLSVKPSGGCFSLAYRTSVCLIPPLRTPSRESLNFPMWIERKLGMDIDPSAYPECWKESNGFFIYYFPIIRSNLHWHKDLLTATSTTLEPDNEFTKASSSAG